MTPRPAPQPWSHGGWRLAVAWGVGLLASLVIFSAACVWVETVGQAQFESLARDRREALVQAAQAQVEVLYSVRNFFNSSEQVTRDEFTRFAGWPLKHRAELESVAWLSREPRSGPAPSTGSQEAGARFVVLFAESKDGNAELGQDDYADPARRQAMDAALNLNEPVSVVVTGAVATNNEATSGARIAIYLPVFRHDAINLTGPSPRQSLTGYARSIVRMDKLMDPGVVHSQPHGIDAYVFDVTAPEISILLLADVVQNTKGTITHVSAVTNASPWRKRRQWADRTTIAGREWMMWYVGSTEYREPGRQEVPLAALAASLVCTGLAVGWFSRRLRHEAERDALLGDVLAEMQQRQRVEQERRELLRQLLKAEDEERRRIARELHDATAQHLAAAQMNLAQVRVDSPPAAATKSIHDAMGLIAEASTELRTVSYQLHPPVLEQLGLAGALRDFAAGFARRTGLQIEVDTAGFEGRLPPEFELALFRVAQECLSNVHRHSGSDCALVRLERDADEVRLEVQDSGKGLPKDAWRGGGGVGLRGMRERLNQIGGELDVESDAEGTTILAAIPLEATPANDPEKEAS